MQTAGSDNDGCFIGGRDGPGGPGGGGGPGGVNALLVNSVLGT